MSERVLHRGVMFEVMSIANKIAETGNGYGYVPALMDYRDIRKGVGSIKIFPTHPYYGSIEIIYKVDDGEMFVIAESDLAYCFAEKIEELFFHPVVVVKFSISRRRQCE